MNRLNRVRDRVTDYKSDSDVDTPEKNGARKNT